MSTSLSYHLLRFLCPIHNAKFFKRLEDIIPIVLGIHPRPTVWIGQYRAVVLEKGLSGAWRNEHRLSPSIALIYELKHRLTVIFCDARDRKWSASVLLLEASHPPLFPDVPDSIHPILELKVKLEYHLNN